LVVVFGALTESSSTTKLPIVVLNSTLGPANVAALARRLVTKNREAIILRMIKILKVPEK
jgi:hypothetical protein